MKKLISKISLSFIGFIVVIIIIIGTSAYLVYTAQEKTSSFESQFESLTNQKKELEEKLASVSGELDTLKAEDQYVVNQDLKKELANIRSTYNSAVKTYENLLKLKEISKNTAKFDDTYAKSLVLLTQRNWEEAAKQLAQLEKDIDAEQAKVAATFVIPETVPQNNAPPGQGYSRQQVATDIGNYMVSVIAGDLGSTRVIVDTASDGTCANDCPVLALGDYVSRNGAFAGINGSYFCPASYPTCAGKTNSFDTLLMNKNKVYFNSDNNVFSTVPVVIFGSGFIRFEGQSLNWGRDTGVDSVLANQPMLVSGGNVAFGGDGDPKKGSRGNRSFVANKGNTVFIGVVHSATVAEAAIVLKTMGMENALNLDSGGSTALWSGGYKVGPGRAIPNAILFVGK